MPFRETANNPAPNINRPLKSPHSSDMSLPGLSSCDACHILPDMCELVTLSTRLDGVLFHLMQI